jgi:hypothetical protein
MDKRFKNKYLSGNANKIIEGGAISEPTKGDIGGFSIEFTTKGDTQSFESIIYNDENSRDADLELLIELLNK